MADRFSADALILFGTLAALLVLTVATVAVTKIDLGQFNLALALADTRHDLDRALSGVLAEEGGQMPGHGGVGCIGQAELGHAPGGGPGRRT